MSEGGSTLPLVVVVPPAVAVVRVAGPVAPDVVRIETPGIPGPAGATGAAGPVGPMGGDPGVCPVVAAVDLGGQRVVGLRTDGLAVLAASDDPGHFERVLGVTVAGSYAGAAVMVRRVGPMTDPSWSFEVGPVWLGPNGTLTQDPPAAGFLQQIGFADRADRLFVLVGEPVMIPPVP